MKILNGKEYFATLAKITALRSKDPNTKVGAIIVDKRKRIIATGYNGMPQGNDKFPGKRKGKGPEDVKYSYVVHAEINAVLNATTKLNGATVYLTLFPLFQLRQNFSPSGNGKNLLSKRPISGYKGCENSTIYFGQNQYSLRTNYGF